MSRRRQSRSRISCHLAAAAVEPLENKQLLSGVNSADVPERTITIADPAISESEYLSIEEVHIVDNAIWVLTQTRTFETGTGFDPILFAPVLRPGMEILFSDDTSLGPITRDAAASVTVNAPADLPIQEFRIRGVAGGPATAVGGFTEFHQLLESHTTQVLFRAVDPELSEYRESVYEQLAAEAETLYADQFGQEVEGLRFWFMDDLFRTDGSINLFARSINVDSLSPAAVPDFSSTNNQVDGVDEADIVETDGEYIYTLSNGQLVIVSAADASSQSAVVSRTQLAGHNNQAMFLHNGRLTVISSEYSNNDLRFDNRIGLPSIDFISGRSQTVVTVFDVSDPATPTLKQETVVDGDYQGARAIGDQVYVVINNNDSIPYLPSPSTVFDSNSSTNYRYETREEYQVRLRSVTQNLTPPSVYNRAETEDGTSTRQRLGWLNGARDIVSVQQSQLTSVLQFDASSSTSTPVDDIGIRTERYGQSQIYASANAIYLVNTEYQQAESGGAFIRLPDQNAVSVINKIDISGDRLTLDATGHVNGSVESQFSLDEHNGYLRIVTTTDAWTTESENHVYVLEDTGSDLEIVGSILGLAPTERIYSARFDGDRAWMVTFRQVDPVFSLDLTDPTNPQVTGELKIPGFSEHLQLIDENHLLAIGRGATDEGRALGVEISLFDISDMSSPQLLHRRALSEGENAWGHSSALYDHQAFNYLPESGLLVIPYSDHDSNGLMTLSIDIQDGIEIVGETSSEDPRNYLRSLQIGEFLYGVTYDSVSVLSISDPATVLYEVSFTGSDQTAHDYLQLLAGYIDKLGEVLEIREYVGEDGEHVHQIEIGGLFGLIEAGFEDPLQFEFVVSELESGSEVLRRLTDKPWLTLEEDGTELLENGTYEFFVRTRSRLLDNPEWSEWIQSQIVSIGDDTSEMISDEQLPELAPLLQWSEIADEVRTILDGDRPTFELNGVDHYEVWVTDASTQQMVLRDRKVEGTQRSLEGLRPGKYYSWFRAIFADGTEAPWSPRTNFQIQGKPLELLNNFLTTADALPDFSWGDIAGAESFEIEITSPDGTQAIYTARGLVEARHEITSSLAAGNYLLRVRALLESGVTTDWAESEFTILDRPEVQIHNRRLDLSGADSIDKQLGEAIEIWVNKAGTYDRVFHSTEWTETTGVDLVDAFGLTNQVGDYDIWMRLVEQDGDKSRWSNRQTFQVFHDAISVMPVSQFAVGEVQEFIWEAVDTVESYELFVQKEGHSGAFYRETGIVGSAHRLVNALPNGNYTYWLRGALEDGFTPWTNAFRLTVDDAPAPAIAFDGNQVTWNAVDGAVKHELWINEVDANGNLLGSRVAHFRELTGQAYNTDLLSAGTYRAWVKSYVQTANGLEQTKWSDRLDFTIDGGVSDLFSLFTDRIEDVFSVLDGI